MYPPSDVASVQQLLEAFARAARPVQITANLLNIAFYVLTALGLYTIARRRGISSPWLAWIPIGNLWIIGSLSDQYRYVVRGEIRARRKLLLTLEIVALALIPVLLGLCFFIVFRAAGADSGPDALFLSILSSLFVFLLPLFAISIAETVIRYMALYDIYRSCDPGNATAFLVLSILFSFTTPFFLFFSREKDYGMPPRRDSFIPPMDPQFQ